MRITDFRVYRKFLSRNAVYTIVTIVGFAVSLMFIFLLGVYVKKELSVDKFHKNKDRIYLLASSLDAANFGNPAADLIKDNIPEVESFTRLVLRKITIEDQKKPISVEALFVDSSFFNIFSFKLLEGNPSNVLSTKKSVVLTESFAHKMFGNTNPVGQFLQMDESTSLLITGIMADLPQNTQIPKSEILINYGMIGKYWGDDVLTTWYNSSFSMYFMAKPNTDLPSKTPVILDLFYKNEYWFYKDGFASEVNFIPLEDVYFSGVKTYFANIRTNSKSLVSVYLVITILILVVAILNYINLSVSQAGKRGKESAIKKLLGCNRKTLIFQFVRESMCMTLIAFLLGLLLAFMAESFFNDALNTKLNILDQFDLGFTFIVILTLFFIGFISGLIPATVISHFQPLEVVKGTYNLKIKSVYSKILISFQYIVAICLLACSAFIIKQTFFMKNYNLGFRKNNILIISNTVPANQIPALKSILERIPGVEKLSFPAGTPIDGGNNSSFEYKGQSLSFQTFDVDTAFFDIFGIDIKPTGIALTDQSNWLNQKAYDILQPDTISYTVQLEGDHIIQVAGITSNFHIRSLHTEAGPVMIKMRPADWWPWSIVAKVNDADPFKTADAIKAAYSEFNGGQPFELKFADDVVQEWYKAEDRTIMILGSFTILTFVILLMGIFAMSQYYVRQKEKEIGIRKVNGATEFEVLQMLNMSFIKWIILAFVISLPLIYYVMSSWLENFPYKTTLSWWVYAVTGVVVFLLSMICISIQTWRAATSNPVDTLKAE